MQVRHAYILNLVNKKIFTYRIFVIKHATHPTPRLFYIYILQTADCCTTQLVDASILLHSVEVKGLNRFENSI